MNLSEHSSEVVGFDSTWDADRQALVRDAGTDTMDSGQIEVAEKNVGTSETKDIGVQATPFVKSNSNEETDKKLAAWLRRIMPALEKELSEGVTQVHESSSKMLGNSFVQVSDYQQIDVKSHFPKNSEDLILGTGAWLSIVIQNNPALVLSCSLKTSPNEPKASFLVLFEPQRSKVDGNIYWQEVSAIPLKEPVEFLAVNSENRDIFAGASSSGDLFIWTYVKASSSSNEPRVAEIFSKASEDSILGLTFIDQQTLLCCQSDGGSIVSYKILNKQNCIADKVMKIDQRRAKDSHVTAITNIINNSNDFIIGMLNGKIFYCSLNQFTSLENADPIVREFNSHKFAVKSLKHCRQQSGKNFIVSFDASSEIFIHELDDDVSLKFVIRLPLPIKNTIALTANIEHFFCPLSNGSLEVFNAKNNSRRTIEGHLSGNNVLAEISRNESWLLTGVFRGIFKIYYLCIDE